MHMTPDVVQPGAITSIEGTVVIDDRRRPLNPPPSSDDVEPLPGQRLRYLGAPQAALARRVRPSRRRAVIVNLEGVLVDTREASTLSWLVALHDAGHDVSVELLRHLSGVAAAELVRIAAGVSATSEEGASIIAHQERTFRTWYLPRLLPFVGARRLLQRMKTDGLRLIALSGGSIDLAPDLLRASGVADLLDDIVTADGDSRDEAVAEIVNSATTRYECARENLLLLGDSPYDVATGERHGIDVVALRCGGWTDATLTGAVAVYQDHVHLLAQYPVSPFSSMTTLSSPPQLRLARAQ